MSLDWLGWSALTPTEQLAAISGAATSLGVAMTLRAAFGGLALRRREPSRRIRHRPPSRPTTPKRKRRKGGKGKPKGRR